MPDLRAAIALDDWKLPIFRKRLTKAGYEYQDAGAFTGDTTILTVETDNVLALKKVIEACEAECRKMKKGRK
jgi:ribosomal protein L10